MTAQNVLVLGAASWNRMVYVDHLPQGKEATIFSKRQLEKAGSTGMGKAMAAAALGHRTTLHCALGDDEPARQIIETCIHRGIQIIADIQDGPTPHHLNIMDNVGGRYSVFLSNGVDRPVIDATKLSAAISSADMIFLSLCPSSLVALPLLSKAHCPVHLDLHDYDGQNPWYDPFIACADTIQLSDVALTNPAPVVARLLAGRANQVVLTRGEQGSCIYTDGVETPVPAASARLVDSNGAGDAYAVGLWDAQNLGHPIAEAGLFAAKAAAWALESDTLYDPAGTSDTIASRRD